LHLSVVDFFDRWRSLASTVFSGGPTNVPELMKLKLRLEEELARVRKQLSYLSVADGVWKMMTATVGAASPIGVGKTMTVIGGAASLIGMLCPAAFCLLVVLAIGAGVSVTCKQFIPAKEAECRDLLNKLNDVKSRLPRDDTQHGHLSEELNYGLSELEVVMPKLAVLCNIWAAIAHDMRAIVHGLNYQKIEDFNANLKHMPAIYDVLAKALHEYQIFSL